MIYEWLSDGLELSMLGEPLTIWGKIWNFIAEYLQDFVPTIIVVIIVDFIPVMISWSMKIRAPIS